MKKCNSLLALVLIACLAFSSCSAIKSTNEQAQPSQSAAAVSPDFDMEANAVFDSANTSPEYNDEMLKEENGTGGFVTENRKLIYEADVRLEALNFDETIKGIKEALEKTSGHIAYESLKGNAETEYRNANYTLRVPQKSYSEFLELLAKTGNVLSQTQSTEDITESYLDIEARLKSLRLQEERLLDMMSKAGELDTLLAIQNQLTEVTYSIERYTLQKNNYDNLVQYSTINLEVNQVERITVNKNTFWQRISVAFGESWANFANGCQDLAVLFIYALPTILLFAGIAAVLLIFVGIASKRRRSNEPAVKKAEIKTDENNK